MGIDRRKQNKATLFTKIDKIINLFVDEINNDEEIKRYLVFLTKEPLENYSVDNSNIKVYQYDVPKRIDCDFKYCISKPTATDKKYRESVQMLYPYPYQIEKVNEDRPTVFVYNTYSNCNDGLIATNYFNIDILVPSQYLELEPYGESRVHKVMERIAYLFNKVRLDEQSKKEIGDLYFEISGRVEEMRINKTNYISVVSIPIKTKYINTRTDYGEINR